MPQPHRVRAIDPIERGGLPTRRMLRMRNATLGTGAPLDQLAETKRGLDFLSRETPIMSTPLASVDRKRSKSSDVVLP
jgi:hypothetical protein